jgi:hypothetical protein
VLRRVLSNFKTVKMDASELADVWGPILLRPLPAEAAKAIADREIQRNAVRLLIGRCKVGGVPTTASGEGGCGETCGRPLCACASAGISGRFSDLHCRLAAVAAAPPLLPRRSKSVRGKRESASAVTVQSNYENIVLPNAGAKASPRLTRIRLPDPVAPGGGGGRKLRPLNPEAR